MASLLTHTNFIKEIQSKYSNLFTKKDIFYLISGATFPDLFYFTHLRDYKKHPNFSNFLHKKNNGLKYAKALLKKAKNKKEIYFAIGFYSHFILDKRIHNYLKNKKILKNINHQICECYLDAEFEKSKIVIPYYPKKLIKEIIKEFNEENHKKYIAQINMRNKSKSLFFKISNQVVNKLVNQKYRIISKKKTDTKLKKILTKLTKMFKYKNMGNNVNLLLNPDIKIKFKHIENLYREYTLALKEMDDVINKYKKIILNN